MKYLLICVLLFLGCANSNMPSYVSTSQAIFITKKPQNHNVFVGLDEIKMYIKPKLNANKYIFTKQELNASVIIKGNINYFRKNDNENLSSIQLGFGNHGYRHVGFEYVHNDALKYTYDGQASVLIRIKNNNKFEDYMTNINFQTDKTYTSQKLALVEFYEKISEKIMQYLTFK